MRLIDADMLRDRLKETALDKFNLSDEYGGFIKGLLAADDVINEMPTLNDTFKYCPSCGSPMRGSDDENYD